MKIKINTLTTDLFLELYASVGWEPPCREQVKCALRNTVASFVAYEGKKAVGMVRLIGDGGMSFYIKDFAVLPKCQGMGVGKMLLMELQQYILEHIDKDWAVSLELISTKGAVEFYKGHGFEERPCEWDGPGMFKMIRSSEGL
jgi:GNAT superfamily N-acetyltransferase